MANIKVLTRDGKGKGALQVQGSQVVVGDQTIDRVASVHLDGNADNVWTLTLKVYVDPNAVFGVLPTSTATEPA